MGPWAEFAGVGLPQLPLLHGDSGAHSENGLYLTFGKAFEHLPSKSSSNIACCVEQGCLHPLAKV